MRTGSPLSRSAAGFSFVPILVLAGCAAPPLTGADTGSGQASIQILFPTSSETISYCSSLIVVVDVDGVDLAPEAMGEDAVAGQGHWHLLDGGTYVVSTGEPWATVSGDTALSESRHFFSAELVNNDHQAFDPPVTSPLVEFDVEDSAGCVGGTTSDAATESGTALTAW